MLYNHSKHLSDEDFKNPESAYRGAPFWAWNTTMTEDNIRFMADVFKKMGMGGAHLHVRTGLTNRYLSDEFMDLIKKTREEFSKRGLLTWLYDEDRWPSGAAGGFVTSDHKYRSRYLVFSCFPPEKDGLDKPQFASSGTPRRSTERRLLSRYEIKFENGKLSSYRMLGDKEEPQEGSEVRYAYLEVAGDNPWFNYASYVNTLDKHAIDEFIKITHERYYKETGEFFGKDIPAIFTDEPQFPGKHRLETVDSRKSVIIPFSDDFEESFRVRYGHSLLEHLPELFWETGENTYSSIRYEYHDFVCERFVSAVSDNIGAWCRDHGILLTGHMMEEPTLTSQTAVLGEAMRSYRSFGIPGIDMLCDRREFTTAKQAESAAHQIGAEGVMSELYGVTGYKFDFRGHKLQGDWQAALGVTVRVPHLSWTSMEGEAKRDYPASISYQSPWFEEYNLIEDYFARINTALTRGKPDVRVGVIHPIESFWLLWGNDEETGDIRKAKEEEFTYIVNSLLSGFMDFDFIAESLLADFENGTQSGRFKCGKMDYDAIVVPNLITIRSTTLTLLLEFAKAGGKVIVLGNLPSYVDAKPSDEAKELSKYCETLSFSGYELLNALKDQRTLDIRYKNGFRAENLVYQLRAEGNGKWLFIAHAYKPEQPDVPKPEEIVIKIEGKYTPLCYDALTGNIYAIPYTCSEGQTVIEYEMFAHDSLLLRLDKAGTSDVSGDTTVNEHTGEPCRIPISGKVKARLTEPNVLLLDMAEYSVDGEPFNEKEEILRLDNILRKRFGYPLRTEASAQPWACEKNKDPEHELTLKFLFESAIEDVNVSLGLEHAYDCKLVFNGETANNKPDGTFVDLAIDKVPLGKLKKGQNVLTVTMPFSPSENVEAMYLLGDFGVTCRGCETLIVGKPDFLCFDDITRQDLAFYGGNTDYIFDVDLPHAGTLSISVTSFKCPAIAVTIDGKRKGIIAFSPYELKVPDVDKGRHEIVLTAFGNRMNTFGPLHMTDGNTRSQGPSAWRTQGSRWSYEYRLEPTGILKCPEITLL
ncbi:MAG: hypothetical protein K6E19_04930 [Lachnospiraceae bacterium]|nr:hypothetical protein [Lachnospiraceae bacterium]